jgi:hypothetical protein
MPIFGFKRIDPENVKVYFFELGLVPLDDIQPRWIDGDKCETREEWS